MQANQGCRQKELQRGMQSLCSRGVNLQRVTSVQRQWRDGEDGEDGEGGDDTDTDWCRW